MNEGVYVERPEEKYPKLCECCYKMTDYTAGEPAVRVIITKKGSPDEVLVTLCLRCFARGVKWAAIESGRD